MILGIIALLIGVIGSGIYITAILRGQTRPHLFTWIVWSILASIGYFAQLHDDDSPGTWVMAITALSSIVIALLSLKYGEKSRTRGDWIAFLSSLFAILPWLLTSDPLGSVILISIIDVVAFYPTFRKSWHKPDEEVLSAYITANVKFLLSFCALEVYSLNTLLYPSVIVAINSIFIVMCWFRRQKLAKI